MGLPASSDKKVGGSNKEWFKVFFFVFLFKYIFEQEIGNLSFDKDDQLAVEFVTAAANIRAASFGIPLQNLFEAKGIAGNIVHAVATTNAVIAGLIVIEAIKVLNNDIKNYRYDVISPPVYSLFWIGFSDEEVVSLRSIVKF